jgi:hypothetical protein
MNSKFLLETKAQGNANTLYMILVIAIVAVVLIAVIKPMFRDTLKTSSTQAG